MDGDLPVAFDPGDGFYGDLSSHGVCPSIEFDEFVGDVDRLACKEGRQGFPDEVGRGRASGQEIVDLDDFVAGVDLVQDDGQFLVVGDEPFALVDGGASEVSLVKAFLERDAVPEGRKASP